MIADVAINPIYPDGLSQNGTAKAFALAAAYILSIFSQSGRDAKISLRTERVIPNPMSL